jgi:short-subunit dehydrogenase
MTRCTNALITGASSGIGAALAFECAGPGVVLHLSGRDSVRLEASAAACRGLGAVVHTRVLDVIDAAAMADWIAGIGPLDLVVANAGISAGTGQGEAESPAQVREIFAVNLGGVLNTVLPAMAVMAEQPPGFNGLRGQIAVVASIAAFVPAPGAPAYCASKAAVDAWVVGSIPSARARGIQLTSLCPGYVRSAMTAANRFPMPGLMGADRAARIMLRGVEAGRRRVVFPWWMGLAARLVGLLPLGVSARLLGLAPGKAPNQGAKLKAKNSSNI